MLRRVESYRLVHVVNLSKEISSLVAGSSYKSLVNSSCT